jgi:hypothetical protein
LLVILKSNEDIDTCKKLFTNVYNSIIHIAKR